MAQSNADISAWVKSCAEYLIEKRDRDLFFSGRSTQAGDGVAPYYNYDGVMSEFDSLEREIKVALSRITNLDKHFCMGELIPFEHTHNDIVRAKDALRAALSSVTTAKQDTREKHPPPGKGLSLQKAATRLATGPLAAGDGLRSVRNLAKRIMIEAQLTIPDEKTITNWIRELREEEEEKGNSPLD